MTTPTVIINLPYFPSYSQNSSHTFQDHGGEVRRITTLLQTPPVLKRLKWSRFRMRIWVWYPHTSGPTLKWKKQNEFSGTPEGDREMVLVHTVNKVLIVHNPGIVHVLRPLFSTFGTKKVSSSKVRLPLLTCICILILCFIIRVTLFIPLL